MLATLARNTETAHRKYVQAFLKSGCQQIGALVSWPADLRKGRSHCGASLSSAFLGPGLSTQQGFLYSGRLQPKVGGASGSRCHDSATISVLACPL